MGLILKPQPVKLIVSIFSNEEALINNAKKMLERKFGKTDYQSSIISFNQTDYYEKEFGKNLKRQFLAFKKLIKSENLWKIKIYANNLEEKLSKKNKRKINIDPGYLSQANLILASTKNFFHRIHMHKGIYEEVTLIYQDKTFKPLPWTYPDYLANKKTFLEIRDILTKQLRSLKKQ